ncbi:NADPH:quinone reductase [Streptomyces sp. NPDC101225]|uniref:NADPH:quinone reductase n=1 Tax=Streptomyces sp. NPDC101225 TaxID=3366135 RepID=UPI00380980CE
MRAVVYERTGPAAEVLHLVERQVPQPGQGEVRVKVVVSGLNPVDYKFREGRGEPTPFPQVVPHNDGAGLIDAVGLGVRKLREGQRVWLREAAFRRSTGTAQEYTVVPEHLAVPLPDGISFDTGAAIGIPAMTAHRALTVHEDAPARLEEGALSGATVLVSGGSGAVGHASIQLARWAGARVVSTASTEEKAKLASAAGADAVVLRGRSDTEQKIRDFAPQGVDVIVEVAPAQNAALNAAVAHAHGCVAVYADTGGSELSLPVGPHMFRNLRYQFLITFEMHETAKARALMAVDDALRSGALPVGDEAGLPLLRYRLEETARAHEALERGAMGKVLLDIQ